MLTCQDVRWFLAKEIVREDGSTASLAYRLPSGESLCFRCGRAVEAFIETERSGVIKKCQDPAFRAEFDQAADIIESDGPNPFKEREVRSNSECGLEVLVPAALIPVSSFEQAMDFTLAESPAGIPVQSFAGGHFGRTLEGSPATWTTCRQR
jgi:hypothetical protein